MASYIGKFEEIGGRIINSEWKRPICYQILIDEAEKLLMSEPLMGETWMGEDEFDEEIQTNHVSWGGENSASIGNEADVSTTKSSSQLDFLGNVARLIPRGKTSCSPCFGPLALSVVGWDVSSCVNERLGENATHQQRENFLKETLKCMVDMNQPFHGIANMDCNQICVPEGGHMKYFNRQGTWLIVPVMTMEDLLGWNDSSECYTVMALSGALVANERTDPRNALSLSRSCWFKLDSQNDPSYLGPRLLLEDEIKLATNLVQTFVLALADLATGQGEGKMTPIDFERPDKPLDGRQRKELKYAADKLNNKGKEATVPKLLDISNARVMGVQVKRLDGKHNFPDPFLLCIKSAINWMIQNSERPLPISSKDTDEDDSDDSNSDNSEAWEDSDDALDDFPETFPPSTPCPFKDISFIRTESPFSLSSQESFDSRASFEDV